MILRKVYHIKHKHVNENGFSKLWRKICENGMRMSLLKSIISLLMSSTMAPLKLFFFRTKHLYSHRTYLKVHILYKFFVNTNSIAFIILWHPVYILFHTPSPTAALFINIPFSDIKGVFLKYIVSLYNSFSMFIA